MNEEEDENQKVEFTKFFEDTVNAFLDRSFPDQQENIEKQLDEWRSDLSFVPNLIECIQTTKLSNALFFASLCIKFLLEKFNEEITIPMIEELITGITFRLNHLYDGIEGDINEIIVEFHKCRINLLKCISLIQIYFPDFIEYWHNLSNEDSMVLFGFLFEEEERQVPDAHNEFMKNIGNITNESIKSVLNKSKMSSEWLFLFKYALQKASEIGDYEEFWSTLAIIPDDPELYPKFIDVFQECISNEYFFLSEKSGDFLERIFDIILALIEKLLSPPVDELAIQMTSFLWKEIIDYDNDFLSDRYASLGKDPFNFLIYSLNTIMDDGEESTLLDVDYSMVDNEFFLICESIGEAFNSLIQSNPSVIGPRILAFLSFLIDTVNKDPDKYISTELSIPFAETSKNIDIPIINQFYQDITQPQDFDGDLIISPGSIFAVASSSDSTKNKFSLKVSDNVLEFKDKLPLSTMLYFISECNNFCGQRIHGLIDFVFESIATDNNAYSTKALSKLCKYHPQIIINSPERYEQIYQIEADNGQSDVDIIVNIAQALLYLMDYVGSEHQIFHQADKAISNGMVERLVNFYNSNDDCKFCLQLINNYAQMVNQTLNEFKNISTMSEFLCELCSKIIDTINFSQLSDGFNEETEDFNENLTDNCKPLKMASFVQDEICNFILLCIDSNLITNKGYIIKWVGDAFYTNPVPSHFEVLSKLVDLFPTHNTQSFILGIGSSEDSELMLSALNFVKMLAKDKWENFFSTFSQDYVLGPLDSADIRIVDVDLEIISAIIDMEVEISEIFFDNMHFDVLAKITDGVFTNFEDIEIRRSINIWIKIFEAGFAPIENLMQFVLTKIPDKCAEYHEFCSSLQNGMGELGFDRMFVLKAVYSLKASLAISE